jgi:hypothetical protein
MKKWILLITLSLFFSHKSFAQSITTGDSNVQTSITSKVSGSNCLTHIEVVVNGEKKVVNSTNCGTNNLNINSTGNIQNQTPTPNIFIPQKTIATITPTTKSSILTINQEIKTKTKTKTKTATLINSFTNTFSEYLKNIVINLFKLIL